MQHHWITNMAYISINEDEKVHKKLKAKKGDFLWPLPLTMSAVAKPVSWGQQRWCEHTGRDQRRIWTFFTSFNLLYHESFFYLFVIPGGYLLEWYASRKTRKVHDVPALITQKVCPDYPLDEMYPVSLGERNNYIRGHITLLDYYYYTHFCGGLF